MDQSCHPICFWTSIPVPSVSQRSISSFVVVPDRVVIQRFCTWQLPNKLSFTADKPQACVYNVCVHMLGRHLYACKVCVGTTLQPCAYSWVLDSYPMSQSIKCFLVYYLLYFISLRSHVICSPQPTCLLITLVFSVFCCFAVTSGNRENKKKKGASITG